MIGTLNTDKIETLLKSQIVGRLACYGEDFPYIVPISYAYDGQFIYCHTHEGMKMELMRRNAKVCFQVDSMPDMADWESVVARGEFEEITNHEDRSRAYQILLNRSLPLHSSETTHLGATWPFSGTDADEANGIFFRIKLYEKTGRYEKSCESPAMPG